MTLTDLDRVIALLTRAEQKTVFPERAASAWVNVAEALTLLRQIRDRSVGGYACKNPYFEERGNPEWEFERDEMPGGTPALLILTQEKR